MSPPPSRYSQLNPSNGLKGNHISMNLMLGYDRYQAFDSYESHREAAKIDEQAAHVGQRGDLRTVEKLIKTMRDSDDPTFTRTSSWQWRNVAGDFLRKSYENGHWHIIEYLTQRPQIEIISSTGTYTEWNLPSAVAGQTVVSSDTTELKKLIELGWNITQCHGQGGGRWPSMDPPVLRYPLHHV
jgi:hypothetical protein